MAGGRPTKYKPEYCIALVEYMREGGSFEGFSGHIGVTQRVLYDWVERHEEFLQAKAVGEDLAYKFWEQFGKAGMAGQFRTKTSSYKFITDKKTGERKRVLVDEKEHPATFSASAYIFMMKNRYGWRDKTEIEQTLKTSPTDLSKLTEEELRALGAELSKLIQD